VIKAVFAIPGDVMTLTGGYGYARRVLSLLPMFGVDIRHMQLPDGFPCPSSQQMADALAQLRRVPAEYVLLVDGLALGALPPEDVASLQAPLVALVHHPLAFESGIDPALAEHLHHNEAAVLQHARHVIASSPTTRATLQTQFDVAADKLHVAEPGTDPAKRAEGSGRDDVELLSVGSITPRKGHAVLAEALAGLKDLNWHLTIVGSEARDPECARALQDVIAEYDLSSRITLTGECDADALDRIYAASDLFILPSLYEGYGMVLAEAMARGLPIITTTGGAAAATVPDAAAVKVPPGEFAPLREALARVITDEALRRSLAEASWDEGQRLPCWQDTARIIAAILQEARE
jgi:glycosyltransferase involved in cell wall biosynthesis